MPRAKPQNPIPSHPAGPATFPDTVAELKAAAADATQHSASIQASLRVQNLFVQCFLLNSPGGELKPWMVGIGAFVAWFCDHAAECGYVRGTPDQMADLMCDLIRSARGNAQAHR